MAESTPSVAMLPVCYGCRRGPGDTRQLQVCGKCRANKYCSSECLKQHWRERHKQTCRVLSFALSHPRSKTCQFWKCALKYEPMTDREELVKNRTPELLSMLPLYAAVEDKEGVFQIGPLGGCPEGLEFVTGFILQTLGLSEELASSSEEGYIENVAVYESGYLIGYSRVNEHVMELLCGKDAVNVLKSNKKMDHSVWKITGGYVPATLPANTPLHTPLSDQPLTAADIQQTSEDVAPLTKENLLARLPCYDLRASSCSLHKEYLAVVHRSDDDNTKSKLNAHLLLSYQLLKPETDAARFISGVTVYDESTKRNICATNVHRDTIRMLCGEESLAKLHNCRCISLEAWLLTGGGSDENGFEPVLHQIVKS